jgi:ceramide glucosyltransferase
MTSGEEIVGVNPKINNLIRAYRAAAHDILWVLDSNVMASPGTLARAVDCLEMPPNASAQKRVGIVHHVPYIVDPGEFFGSSLEAAFINTNHARMYLALNILAIDSCVIGKSNLYRRSDLEQLAGPQRRQLDDSGVHGLASFGKYLAEDNMIGMGLWHGLHLRHSLSCDVVLNAVGDMSFLMYARRRVRWIRVRKNMTVAATLIEPFTESVLLGLLAAWALHHTYRVRPWAFLPLHELVWFVVDLDVKSSLAQNHHALGQRWRFIRSWLCRELLAAPIWLWAMSGDSVTWRGKLYRLLGSGEVQAVPMVHNQ